VIGSRRLVGLVTMAAMALLYPGCRHHAGEDGAGASDPGALRTGDATCGAAGQSCTSGAQCCSNRCDFSRAVKGGAGACGGLDIVDGPFAAVSPSLKQDDLRLNPPRILDRAAIAGPDGQAIITATIAADRRIGATLSLPTDDGSIVLHDDGAAGDEKAGDHVFSAALPIAFTQLQAQERATAADLEKRRITQIPIFDGPQQTGVQSISFQIDPSRVHFFPPVPTFDVTRTLMITDPAVVEDPSRTFNPCAPAASAGTPLGTWTFGYLMTQMANQAATGTDPADLVLDWLSTWSTSQVVNGFGVTKRPTISDIIDAWPKVAATGKLDLAKAPMKLLAIVNRIDLAGNASYGNVGGAEGRFVFGVLTPTCGTRPFTVILEYGVPRRTCSSLRDWAIAWRNLDGMTPGTSAYDAALEALTEQFAHANADPTKLAGSAIDQVRTDENALHPPGTEDPEWELREFTLGLAAGGVRLGAATVKQTPDENFNGERGGGRSADLATWINANEAALLAGTATVPVNLPFPPGDHFLAGSTLNFFTFINGTNHKDYWTAAGITNNQARHKMSLNTCNGCHGEETHTGFLHVHPTTFGSPASLSGFLTGTTVPDPVVPSTSRTFNELASRAVRLEEIADSTCGKLSLVKAAAQQVFPLPPLGLRPHLATH